MDSTDINLFSSRLTPSTKRQKEKGKEKKESAPLALDRKRAVASAQIELADMGAIRVQRMGMSVMSVRKMSKDALTVRAPNATDTPSAHEI